MIFTVLCIVNFGGKTAFGSELHRFGIETERLLIRSWNQEDIKSIHAITQDPEVNRYLGYYCLDNLAIIEHLAETSNKNIEQCGCGYFICQLKNSGEVIGIVGLNEVHIEDPHFPCHTISYILGKKSWKNGYATEAAKAIIKYGRELCKISKIFACTVIDNANSRRVMERLGMRYVDSFDYPGIPKSDPQHCYVLYELE